MGRGWRVCVAAENAKRRQCGCGKTMCDHWRELGSYYGGLVSSDQEHRLDTLKSLGSLLLCLASGDDSTNVDEDYALHVPVGETTVCVSHDDVVRLYKVLFQELSKIYTVLLSDLCSEDTSSEIQRTEALAHILCCCIRIIPVVDMFNTSLGHSGSLAVNEILQQLCSLTGFFSMDRHLIVLRSCLLEVFLEEILLHRDSTCSFLAAEAEDVVGGDLQSQVSIDAAFAHMLHHHSLRVEKERRLQLSLPAGVLLLDISMTVHRIPSSFLAHIISLVSETLLPMDNSKVPHASRVDNLEVWIRKPAWRDDVPHGVAIGLASSVIETAMGLLAQHYSTSVLTGANEGFGENDRRGELLSALLRAISSAMVRIVNELQFLKAQGPGGGTEGVAIRRSLDAVAAAISFNLPSLRFMEAIGCYDQEMVGAIASKNTDRVIGWTLVIFAHILFYESQRGLEDVLAGDYLRVLDSLVGLLAVERNNRIETDDNLTRNGLTWGGRGRTNSFLDQMIKLLQRTVWDMCSRKKSTSKLLSFIAKVTPVERIKETPSETVTPDVTYQDDHCDKAVHDRDASKESLELPVNPRPSTLVIAKWFKLNLQRNASRWEPRKRTRNSIMDISSDEEAGANPYIAEMLKRHKEEESFDDLRDFIACKKGRDYSKFLNTRIKVRRKIHTRLIWKRREERRALVRLLETL